MKQKQVNKIEWKKVELGDLLDYEQPSKYIVNEKILKDKSEGALPVLTANKAFILGYTKEKEGIYDNPPVIIFDDFTTDFKFVDFKFKVKSSAMKILKSKTENIDIKFIFFMMKGVHIDYSKHKRYYLSAYQRRKILMPFKGEIPNLEEQKRIVSILEKTEHSIKNGEKTNMLLEEFLESTFIEMFYKPNFERLKLGEICKINPRKSELENVDKETLVSFLSMADIGEKGEIFNEEIKKLKEVFKGFTYFRKNDILFAKITPCMENGKGAIAKISKEIGFGSTEFHVLRPNEKISPDFIYFLLSLKSIRKLAESKMSGSAGQKRVPKYFLESLRIPLPPISSQNKFSKIVEQAEKMKEDVNKTKKNAEELFDSLLSKAFRGEL